MYVRGSGGSATHNSRNIETLDTTVLISQDKQEVTFKLKNDGSISVLINNKNYISNNRVFIKDGSITEKLKKEKADDIFQQIKDITEYLKDFELIITEEVEGRSIQLTMADL